MARIHVHVGPEIIDLSELDESGPEERCGARLIFLGVVRKQNHGKKVVSVAYDSFTPLAEATLRKISEEAAQRWGEELEVDILHRIGRLEVGDASVLISVKSPHRDAAYEASRYLIEELKQRAPIWKKEFYENGETEWLKGHALCSHQGGDSRGRTVLPHGHG